jgi:hypothetical protein
METRHLCRIDCRVRLHKRHDLLVSCLFAEHKLKGKNSALTEEAATMGVMTYSELQ